MGVRELASLPTISALKEAQEDAYGPATDFMKSNEEYIVDGDGLLSRDANEGARVLVPELLRKAVLEYLHGAPTTGHYGVSRTCRNVKDRFWWPGVRACVSAFVSKCLTCQMYRASKLLRQGNMQVYHPLTKFEIVAVDVLEISPKSSAGNIKVVVIGNTFTRFVWAYPVKDEKAETIASVLLDGWILRYGLPEKLLSDRGKAFAGRSLARTCEMVGVKKIFTTGYHPKTDGFVERLNRTLRKDLAAFVMDEVDWDGYLAVACFRYNTSVHEATDLTPFEAMFGIKVFDFDAEIGWKTFIDENEERSFPEQLSTMHDELVRRGMLARGRAAKNYDKAVKLVEYGRGDRVLLCYPPEKVKTGRKLRTPSLGPYKAVQKLSSISYVLKAEVSGEVARVHVNRLRRFSQNIVETGAPQAEVYPDSRRMSLKMIGCEYRGGERWMKLASKGRNGYVWSKVTDRPEVVVRLYDLGKEDRRVRFRA